MCRGLCADNAFTACNESAIVRLRKLIFVTVVALVGALVIGYMAKPLPYQEKLIRIQSVQELGHLGGRVLEEPLDIQALLLAYTGDHTLLMKAWIALEKYPQLSREVFRLYGAEPEFKAILLTYGEAVIPVIQYFLDNEVLSITVADKAKEWTGGAKKAPSDAWDWLAGNESTTTSSGTQNHKKVLGPTERGWYAVNFIQQEGYGFLAQFVIGNDHEAKWIQTTRYVAALTSFFTSGIRNLETRFVLGEEIRAQDGFFAALDVVPMVVAFKLLRAGKVAAASSKEISLASRTKVFASRLVPRSPLFLKLGKYGVVVATAYVVVTHPSLINSVLAEVAALVGVNPLLLQSVVWFLLIAVALYPFLWLLKMAAKSILLFLSWIERVRKMSIPAGSRTPAVMVGAPGRRTA